MKRGFIYALLCAATLALGSCGEKSEIGEMRDLIEEVRDKGKTYTKEQWDEANHKFLDLLEKVNADKNLTKAEQQEIAKLQNQYSILAFKARMKKMLDTPRPSINDFMSRPQSDDKPKDK